MVEFVVAIDISTNLGGTLDTANIERAVAMALQIASDENRLPEHPVLTVSVRVTDDREIQSLNQLYRGVDKPTDVLSFSFIEDSADPAVHVPKNCPIELGEIILSQPRAADQADQLGHTLEMELAWLSIHATLQLLGYHHAEEREALHMECLEKQALARLGFSPD